MLCRMSKAYVVKNAKKIEMFLTFKLFLKTCDKISNNVFQFKDKKNGKRILVLCS